MKTSRSVIVTAVLAALLSGLVALATPASASTEVVPNCDYGPSGGVCISLVYERFATYTQIKTKITAQSNGPLITLNSAGTVRYINNVKQTHYADGTGGATKSTTGPLVSLYTSGFHEDCDVPTPSPGFLYKYSGHGTYTANGVSYGIDTGQWGGLNLC
jgi:hypothetical protein